MGDDENAASAERSSDRRSGVSAASPATAGTVGASDVDSVQKGTTVASPLMNLPG